MRHAPERGTVAHCVAAEALLQPKKLWRVGEDPLAFAGQRVWGLKT